MEQPIKKNKFSYCARSRLRFRPQEIWERDYVHYRVMEHAGSFESTKEAQELPEAIAEGNSIFLSALQTSQVLRNSIVHS